LDQVADRVEPRLDRLQQIAVLGGQLSWLGNGAEGLVRRRERAVDEIAPVRDDVAVVPANELRPREVRVLRLRTGRGQEEAERIRVVAAQEVADRDRDTAADAELLALHRQELARDDIVGQVERLAGSEAAALPPPPPEPRRRDRS